MFIEQTNGQIIKIKFDISEKPLLLGDILKITAPEKDGVLAQILEISSTEKTSNFNVAVSKILFTVEQSGRLTAWQGNVPSQEFRISRISSEEILLCANASSPQSPVQIGNLSLYPDTEVDLEASFFESPTVIYCDKQTQKNNILNLLSCELSKNGSKTVLIDFNGDFSDLKVSSVINAGKNFKIPLNLKGLEYLYDKTLYDVSAETRAVIEDIFIEIENYLSSGDVEYIPFSSLMQAVNSVYETNKIAELVLLRNKLSKLQKCGIFADKKQEFAILSRTLENTDLVIADFSEIPAEWKRKFIEFIVDSNIEKYKQNFFLLFDSEKVCPDKIFIEKLCGKANKSGISPVIISGHESEHSVVLLAYTKSVIAFAPENATKITSLSDYITRLKDNEVLITGKITNNVPLYVNIFDMEAFEEGFSLKNSDNSVWAMPEIYLSQEIEEDNYSSRTEISDNDTDFNYSGQFAHDDSEVELISDISNLQEDVYFTEEEESIEEDYGYAETQKEQTTEEDFDSYNFDEPEIKTPLEENSFEAYNFAEEEETYIEEDEFEYKPKVIETEDDGLDFSSFVSNPEEYGSQSYSSGDKQVDEDFDYNSSQEFQDESILDYYDNSVETQEDDTESAYSGLEQDLYADNAQSYGYSDDNLQQSFTTAVASPPIPDIPVYPTYDNQEDIAFLKQFKEGDRVQHSKYGIGTIVKIIGYETKKLCSIQFDEAGRRLLDPKLSGLVKI